MARMDGGELRCRREYLGLTADALAVVLGVNPRTIRSWEQGRDPIPERISAELADVEAHTRDVVQQVIDRADRGACEVSIIRHGDGDIDTDGRWVMPARWWHHVAARAREQNPAITIGTADN